jgi:hypothetical protein
MGKYDPLQTFLMRQQTDLVPVKFTDLEAVLGFELPASKQYPAWWSNNPSNNPMTKIWLKAGYATEQVDTAAERLVFRRTAARREAAAIPRSGSFPGYGAMKGTVRAVGDLDLTDPADPAWSGVFE